MQIFLTTYKSSTSFFIYSVKDPSVVSFPLQGLTQFDFWQFSLHPCIFRPPKTYLSLLLNPLSKAALMCRWTRQLSSAASCWGGNKRATDLRLSWPTPSTAKLALLWLSTQRGQGGYRCCRNMPSEQREWLLLPSAPLDDSQRSKLDLSLTSPSQFWFFASPPGGTNTPSTHGTTNSSPRGTDGWLLWVQSRNRALL